MCIFDWLALHDPFQITNMSHFTVRSSYYLESDRSKYIYDLNAAREILDEKFQFKDPVFDSYSCDFIDWLVDIKCYFDCYKISSNFQFARRKLVEQVKTFWTSVEIDNEKNKEHYKNPIYSCAEMKNNLIQEHLPTYNRNHLFNKLDKRLTLNIRT